MPDEPKNPDEEKEELLKLGNEYDWDESVRVETQARLQMEAKLSHLQEKLSWWRKSYLWLIGTLIFLWYTLGGMDGRIELKIHPKPPPGPTSEMIKMFNADIRETQRTAAINKLAKKHNAIQVKLPENKPLFSFHLQEYFENLSPNPILFSDSVHDIAKEGQSMKISFGSYSIFNYGPIFRGAPQLHYVLECPLQEVQKIKEDNETWDVAVIGVVSSVQRVPYEPYAVRNENSAWVETKPTNTFVAYGKCLELLPLNEEGIATHLGKESSSNSHIQSTKAAQK